MYRIIKKSPFSSLWNVPSHPCLFEPSPLVLSQSCPLPGRSPRILQPLDILTRPEFQHPNTVNRTPFLLELIQVWTKVPFSAPMYTEAMCAGRCLKPSSFLSENKLTHIKRNTGETEDKSMSSADPDFFDLICHLPTLPYRVNEDFLDFGLG